MILQLENFHKSNEILYVLHAIHQNNGKSVSKIALQKLLYLSAALAPIKEIILSIIRFQRIQRGPYSKDIQNIVDHLVAYGLVEITEFKVIKDKNAFAVYEISDGGKNAVSKLLKYSVEAEKYWWISCISRLSLMYAALDSADDDEEFEGLDKIVRIVYQDYTFKETKENSYFRALIDFDDTDQPTAKTIEFVKDYIEQNRNMFSFMNERFEAELILTAFFNHFYNNYLIEYSV
ncbi:hypothetical protein ASU31_18855 [Pedobacter ginsenosidimutans]|uniref:Uncharacterized protein n=1 Tax=Pedobacter ginsenosidimutans TaxID=687842 RepID=A0A0T5VKV6_9SPHI|nr:hypothetical protein [Pedobacter ginsenosidimutans]KRT14487.1 hypothetical protein ASU31_18855 [Pedobacter ginsenosidimutans]